MLRPQDFIESVAGFLNELLRGFLDVVCVLVVLLTLDFLQFSVKPDLLLLDDGFQLGNVLVPVILFKRLFE